MVWWLSRLALPGVVLLAAFAVFTPTPAGAETVDSVIQTEDSDPHGLFRPAGGIGPGSTSTTSSTLLDQETTTTTTTTTLGGPPRSCGDPTQDGAVTASDALYTLNVAVGLLVCDPCVCDIDGTGAVSATDALVGLRISIGQPFGLNCPICR